MKTQTIAIRIAVAASQAYAKLVNPIEPGQKK